MKIEHSWDGIMTESLNAVVCVLTYELQVNKTVQNVHCTCIIVNMQEMIIHCHTCLSMKTGQKACSK